MDKERNERRCNIVLKGVKTRMEGEEKDIRENLKEWVTKFLREKLECKVENCRLSGRVIIARLGSEGEKAEVMKRKNRLKEGNIFIENDLSWEERKVQEKVMRWAREEKNKGGHKDRFGESKSERNLEVLGGDREGYGKTREGREGGTDERERGVESRENFA